MHNSLAITLAILLIFTLFYIRINIDNQPAAGFRLIQLNGTLLKPNEIKLIKGLEVFSKQFHYYYFSLYLSFLIDLLGFIICICPAYARAIIGIVWVDVSAN